MLHQIFTGEPDQVDKQLRAWLSKARGLSIHHILQSESVQIRERQAYQDSSQWDYINWHNLTITVFYEED
jgi:hypothetical protein